MASAPDPLPGAVDIHDDPFPPHRGKRPEPEEALDRRDLDHTIAIALCQLSHNRYQVRELSVLRQSIGAICQVLENRPHLAARIHTAPDGIDSIDSATSAAYHRIAVIELAEDKRADDANRDRHLETDAAAFGRDALSRPRRGSAVGISGG